MFIHDDIYQVVMDKLAAETTSNSLAGPKNFAFHYIPYKDSINSRKIKVIVKTPPRRLVLDV